MSAAKSPELRAREACRWIAENLDAFDWLVGVCLSEADKGNPRFMRGDAYKMAREKKVRLSNVEKLCRDNNLWAVLTRFAAMKYPRITRTVHYRDASIDDASLLTIWHEEVDADTEFRAATWRAAMDMCRQGEAA
ncbi:MAG: hypothetical protein RSG23_10560 [Gordonibacter sp.]|uniref:hypothetical protein n=1 Tax=Gordonibacter sp. TaxID=1968902 RepID=UPI002FC7DE4C